MSSLGNKEIMAENIKYQMQLNNKKAIDICNALDIKKNTFSDWVNAKTYPRIDKIEQMANYFHCSKSALVEKRGSVDYVVPELNVVIEAMDETTKQHLYSYALFLLGQKDAPLNSDRPITMQVTEGEQKLINELRERKEIDHETLEQMFNTILHYKQEQKTLTFTDQANEHSYYMISIKEFLK